MAKFLHTVDHDVLMNLLGANHRKRLATYVKSAGLHNLKEEKNFVARADLSMRPLRTRMVGGVGAGGWKPTATRSGRDAQCRAQELRSKVGTIGPNDCSQLGMQPEGLEIVPVFQRLEDFAFKFGPKVHFAFHSINEA